MQACSSYVYIPHIIRPAYLSFKVLYSVLMFSQYATMHPNIRMYNNIIICMQQGQGADNNGIE